MSRSILVVPFMLACSSSIPGTHPHDMSVAQHERAAQEHTSKADAHRRAYDPAAQVPVSRCPLTGQRPALCWTSVENPTTDHLRQAGDHQRHAADHRAASAALRDAEARACGEIADEDRDTSPFDRADDIAAVEPLKEEARRKEPVPRTIGAIVTFRARPGMTAEWLQRVVDCHLARNAALGHIVPEMPNCPLVPKGVTARVSSIGNGFAVAIRADDLAVASEVLARARRSWAVKGAGGQGTTRSRR